MRRAIVVVETAREHEWRMERELSASRPFTDRIRAAIDARTDAYFAIADCGTHGSDLVHCSNSAVRLAHTAFKQAEQGLFTTVLREGARAGELAVTRPVSAAQALLAAYARFSPPSLLMMPRDEARALLRSVHELVLFGLVKRAKR